MTIRRISEDAPEFGLAAYLPKHPIDVRLGDHEVERAVERLSLRARAEHPSRAIELLLVKLYVLVPQSCFRRATPPRRLCSMVYMSSRPRRCSRPALSHRDRHSGLRDTVRSLSTFAQLSTECLSGR